MFQPSSSQSSKPSSSTVAEPPVLGIAGFGFADLFSPYGLRRLYDEWLVDLQAAEPAVAERYLAYRAGAELEPIALSNLLVDTAPSVSRFLVRLFPQIQPRTAQIRATTQTELAIFRFKDEFVKRRALKRKLATDEDKATAIAQGTALLTRLGVPAEQHNDELAVAQVACSLLDQEARVKEQVSTLEDPKFQLVRADADQLADWVLARREELAHTTGCRCTTRTRWITKTWCRCVVRKKSCPSCLSVTTTSCAAATASS
jgi:hypothetical protein